MATENITLHNFANNTMVELNLSSEDAIRARNGK